MHEDIQPVPGPGSYNLNIDIGGPKYQISRAERYFNKKYASPGPGAYDIKKEEDTPSYTMNSRRSFSSHAEIPGPGAYSPSIRYNTIKYSIGRSEHFKVSIKDTPGPGTYSPNSGKKSQITIGLSKRPPLSIVLDTPGPGSYYYANSNKTPAYTISRKNNIKKLDADPVIFI